MERAGVLFVWRKERAGGSRVCTEVPGCGAEHAQRGREWRGERVGGQDGRGWTLARSLSKRRLKVYTYAVGGSGIQRFKAAQETPKLARGLRKATAGREGLELGLQGPGETCRMDQGGENAPGGRNGF